MFNKVISSSTIHTVPVVFSKGRHVDRELLFRYAKFITQTYKLYRMLRSDHIDPSLLSVTEHSVREHRFFYEEDIEADKQMYREIQRQVDRARRGEARLAVVDIKHWAKQIYALNLVYSLRFLDIVRQLGVNGHEKSSFLFLAQRDYLNHLWLNVRLPNGKEVDAVIMRDTDMVRRQRAENVLVEDKKTLRTNSFQQIFGYLELDSERVSHVDSLSYICERCGIEKIDTVEIVYSFMEDWFRDVPLGILLEKSRNNRSVDLAVEEFLDEYALGLIDDKNKCGLLNSTVENIVFTRVVHGDMNVLDKCLNPLILGRYQDLFTKN